jgi:DNA-binding NtrC family response regulator
MAQGKTPWSLLLLDLCFYTGRVTEESHRRSPGMPAGRPGDDDPRSYFGLTLLDAIHREFPELPIFILSSKPREEVSLEFSRRGALGFIARDDLRGSELLEEALQQHGLLPDPTGEIVGHSLPLLLALREARRAARHRENLLIRGERGTGKELLARYIHRMHKPVQKNSVRPFVAVNSAVFTPSLFAAELFGIQPRTATGVDGKTGLIEAANGGDLFLDEIADMPLEVQAAVLRALQERQFTSVGAREPKSVDVRFLSATNAELEEASRGFRSDLLDRLSLGGSLWLPPLRERRGDISLLVEKFVREAEASRTGTMHRNIAPEALEMLRAHDWPGNIRELRSAIFDAVNRHPDMEHLVPGHLRLSEGIRRAGVTPQPLAEEVSLTAITEETANDTDPMREWLETQSHLRFDPQQTVLWAGRLDELQLAHYRLMARYLLAAVQATKRCTPKCPQGIIQIQPAAKLATGNDSLSASKAADLFKRLLGPLEYELQGELQEVLAIAIRLRPRTGKAKLSSLMEGKAVKTLPVRPQALPLGEKI